MLNRIECQLSGRIVIGSGEHERHQHDHVESGHRIDAAVELQTPAALGSGPRTALVGRQPLGQRRLFVAVAEQSGVDAEHVQRRRPTAAARQTARRRLLFARSAGAR